MLCKIQNSRFFASAKWIREETKQILETANFSNVENSESHYHRFSHIIDKVSTDDAGYYTCVVTFDGRGRQTLSYKLQVTGKWFISLVILVIYSCTASVLVSFFSLTCLSAFNYISRSPFLSALPFSSLDV